MNVSMGRSLLFGVLLACGGPLHVSAGQSSNEGSIRNSKRRTEEPILRTNNSGDSEVEGRRDDVLRTNNSDDDPNSQHAFRVDLPPFAIILKPTLAPLQGKQLAVVEKATETIIEEYLTDVVEFKDGVSFGYLSLLGVEQHEWVADGLSYCGTSWADANDKCKQPCSFGFDKECPGNQRCYANTKSCPLSSGRRERRALQGGNGLSSGHRKDRRLGSAYTVLKMAGGLATFKITPGAEPPTEEELSSHAAEGIAVGLAEALRAEPEDSFLSPAASLKDIAEAVAVQDDLFGPAELSDPTPPLAPAPSPAETQGGQRPTSTPPASEGGQQPTPTSPDTEGGQPTPTSPDTEGNDQALVLGATLQDGEQGPGKENNSPTAAIAGAVVGVAIALLLLALFVRRARRKKVPVARESSRSENHSDFDSEELSGSEGKSSDFNSVGPSSHSLGTIHEREEEDETTADSSSSWAVESRKKENEQRNADTGGQSANEEGEETSLGTARSRNTPLANGVPIHQTDSFEIRRQFESISVRKDMMLTTSLERKTNRTHAMNTERSRQLKTADIEDTRNLMSYPNRIPIGSDDSEDTWNVQKRTI